MTVTSYIRGHKMYYDENDKEFNNLQELSETHYESKINY